ncbi:MAG: zinc-ribbon domain-containing protein [Desulfobacterales bacterium]|nr:zinc-ribbon domain-containing protein [Desulfobacterales bacterium]
MLVTCTECNTSFTMEDRGIKKAGSKVRCSRCKNIFVVYPPESNSTSEIPEDFKEELDALDLGSGKEEDLPEGEEIDFDELDKMLEADDELELEESSEAAEGEPDLPGVGDLDFSELEKALDIDESLKAVETAGTGKKESKPEEEEFDLDELDKALGMDEDLELEEIPKIAEEKPAFQGKDDLGLSEIEEALEMDESTGAGKAAETGKEDFDFAELEEDLGIDEKPEPEEITEVMEEEPALPEEKDIGLFGLEEALDTDGSAKAGKTADTEELVFDELDKMFGTDDEQAGEGVPESGEKESAVSESGDFDFSELEKALDMDESPKVAAAAEAGKGSLPGEEDLDFSDMDNLFDTEKTPEAEAVAVKGEKAPGFFDTEDIDFSDLEKMLETGEIKLDEMGLEKKSGKDMPGDGEAFDLSDLETAIEKSGNEGIEEVEEEPEELKLDFKPEKDELLSKIEDVEELDFSDLEDMAVSGETSKPPEKQEIDAEELIFDFDLDEKTAGMKGEAEETADSDLSVLDKIISSADEPEQDISLEKAAEEFELDFDLESAGVETPDGEDPGKAYQDTQELDFSDLENIMVGEKPGGGKEKDTEQELEFDLDLVEPSGVEAEAHADEVTELDFSDVDKMLEMEGMPGEQEKEPEGEVFELQLGTDDSSDGEQADRFMDTLVSDEMGLKISSGEHEHEDVHKHLEGFEIDKFQETREIGAKKAQVAVAEEDEKDKKEVKKAKKPLKIKKPSGKFLIILGILVILLLGAGAFVVYNPFNIEIPFVSDFLGSKADEKGNLKITPLTDSIKGDYVDTKFGTLFVIKGDVKNDYKKPRSYIRVVGKLFAKGKKLSKAETVFCGNIIPEQDIANLEPAVLKKRLQNRNGDKKSNVQVKPGNKIPFMIIYENPSLELDEFTVEAEGSMKE